MKHVSVMEKAKNVNILLIKEAFCIELALKQQLLNRDSIVYLRQLEAIL